VFNNLSIEGTFLGTDTGNNMTLAAWPWPFADPLRCDLRPVAGSPAQDAGRQIAGITDGFAGAAPDIGAYETDGGQDAGHWLPGV